MVAQALAETQQGVRWVNDVAAWRTGTVLAAINDRV
jgi:hypothetical protein